MAALKRLSSMKGDQLKFAAFLLGLPNSGTKAQLAAAISYQLSNPPVLQNGGRIVSVDMGIRNLGICVLQARNMASRGINEKLELKIVGWKKIDVLNKKLLPLESIESNSETSKPFVSSDTKRTRPLIDPKAFTPHHLSKSAVDIATRLLHSYQPSHILIERQRFRSGGASAVQEWTLRVNMLESMLWASFETLRRATDPQHAFPEVHEISPERVARFWNDQTGGGHINFETLLPGLQLGESAPEVKEDSVKRHVDKKERIALVRSWLSDESMNRTPYVRLEVSDEARAVANSFLSASRKSRSRTTSEILPLESGPSKLDDLADSLLQGVAWIHWVENHIRLREAFESEF